MADAGCLVIGNYDNVHTWAGDASAATSCTFAGVSVLHASGSANNATFIETSASYGTCTGKTVFSSVTAIEPAAYQGGSIPEGTYFTPGALASSSGLNYTLLGTHYLTDTPSASRFTSILIPVIPDKKHVLDSYACMNESGTLTLPSAANVWKGSGTFGVVGALTTPSKKASDVTNCSAGNIKKDIVVGTAPDTVTGTYEGSGGTGGVLLVGGATKLVGQ